MSEFDFDKQQKLVSFLIAACHKNWNPDPKVAEQTIDKALQMGASAKQHPIFLRLLAFYAVVSTDAPVLNRIARLWPDELTGQARSLFKNQCVNAMGKLVEHCPEQRPKIEPLLKLLKQRKLPGLAQSVLDLTDPPDACRLKKNSYCGIFRRGGDENRDEPAILSH